MSNAPLAPREKVKRWLSSIPLERKPTTKTGHGATRNSQRKHTYEIDGEDSHSEKNRKPRKQRKSLAKSRSRSPQRRKTHSVEETNHDIGDPGKSLANSSSSELEMDRPNDDLNPRSRRSQHNSIEDPSKKYVRRLRHKTHTDRYEYKGDAVKRSGTKNVVKKAHKRSRRKKSGDALNRDFKAPNIEKERLTLKAYTGPGLFGKGKASALLQTRGLPDLTFSEMTFLTKKKLSEDSQPDKRKSIRFSKKDRSQEISKFFSNSLDESLRPCRSPSEKFERRQSVESTERSRSPVQSSPASLIDSNDLSLDGEKFNATRRCSAPVNQVLTSNDAEVTGGPRPLRQCKRTAVQGSELVRKLAEGPTSYYSSCAAPSRPRAAHQRSNSSEHEQQEMPTSHSAQRPKVNPVLESSVTNSSLDRFTKDLLRLRHHEISGQPYGPLLEPDGYSLDDLKWLARMAEIEEKYSELPRTVCRHRDVRELKQRSNLSLTSTRPAVYPDLERVSVPNDQVHYYAPQARTAPKLPDFVSYSACDVPRLDAQSGQALRSISPILFLSEETNYQHTYPYAAQVDYSSKRNRCLSSHHIDRYGEELTNALREQGDEVIFDEEELLSHREQTDMRETFKLAGPTRRDAQDSVSDAFDPNHSRINHGILELQGLHWEDEVSSPAEDNVKAPATGYEECYLKPVGVNINARDFPSQTNSAVYDSREKPLWNTRSSLYRIERPEEEFTGFSRPQTLY